MARGKTKYVVPITDPRIAQDVMNEYLSNYDYRQMSENGVVYYKSG